MVSLAWLGGYRHYSTTAVALLVIDAVAPAACWASVGARERNGGDEAD